VRSLLHNGLFKYTIPKMMRIPTLKAAALLVLFVFTGASCASGEQREAAASKTVTLCSFNIQIFGAAKMAKPGVKEVLAEIVSSLDICAVQEVRSALPDPVLEFMALLPERYLYILGEREGRSSSKEQYWVIFDSEKFYVQDAEAYPDAEDKFERDPLGVYFKTSGAFDFILIDNHISPSDAANEIAALPEAASWFRELWGETDIIILGDFNADGAYYNEDALVTVFPAEEWLSLITNDYDTTVAASSNTYDRIIISVSTLEDFAGAQGVLRFDEAENFPALGIEAKTVSDHYPVWASFYLDCDTD